MSFCYSHPNKLRYQTINKQTNKHLAGLPMGRESSKMQYTKSLEMAAQCPALCQMLGHREAREIMGDSCGGGRSTQRNIDHSKGPLHLLDPRGGPILTEPARTMFRRRYLRQTYYSWVNSTVWTLDRRLARPP